MNGANQSKIKFGKKLKEIRMQNNLTQINLALKIGDTNQAPLCRYENGLTWPSLPKFVKICKVLGVEYSDLI